MANQLRETPDERLEINVIPRRIAELSLMPFSKAMKKRLDFLQTRLHECPADIREKGKAAIRNWNAAHEVPRFVKAAPSLDGNVPTNVMAGLLVDKSSVDRGYNYRTKTMPVTAPSA